MDENEIISPEVTGEEEETALFGYEATGERLGGETADEEPTAAPERDFSAEAEALLTAFPDMAGKSLPEEVVSECVQNGVPLVRAYAAYRERSARSRYEELRRNSDSASRAPVRAVSMGAPVENAPADPFLLGLNEY